MATAYTTYSQNAKRIFQYQFTCEHCGEQSPMKNFTVTAIASKDVSGKGSLSPEAQSALRQEAELSLQNAIKSKRKFIEKGNYGQDINGTCDSCGKRQSWEVKSARLLPLWGSLQGLLAGFLLMLFSSILGKEVGNAMTVCMPIGFVIGLVIGIVKLSKISSDNFKNTTKSKPVIYW